MPPGDNGCKQICMFSGVMCSACLQSTGWTCWLVCSVWFGAWYRYAEWLNTFFWTCLNGSGGRVLRSFTCYAVSLWPQRSSVRIQKKHVFPILTWNYFVVVHSWISNKTNICPPVEMIWKGSCIFQEESNSLFPILNMGFPYSQYHADRRINFTQSINQSSTWYDEP